MVSSPRSAHTSKADAAARVQQWPQGALLAASIGTPSRAISAVMSLVTPPRERPGQAAADKATQSDSACGVRVRDAPPTPSWTATVEFNGTSTSLVRALLPVVGVSGRWGHETTVFARLVEAWWGLMLMFWLSRWRQFVGVPQCGAAVGRRACGVGGVPGEPAPDRPRIRRAAVPVVALLVVRGVAEIEPGTSIRQAVLFQRRFPAWGRFGLSAFYARSDDEVLDLGEDRLDASRRCSSSSAGQFSFGGGRNA